MNTERTSLFLMANLGSEVSKIFSAKEKGNKNLFEGAMNRAKIIISKLKELPDTKNNKEIDILKDVILDLENIDQKYQISAEQLKSYFYPFILELMNT